MTSVSCRPALSQHYFDIICRILDREFRQGHAEAYIFGSRARGDSRQWSDIDLAIRADHDSATHLAHIRESLEESVIPFESDVVDVNAIDPAVRASIEQEGILIWKK